VVRVDVTRRAEAARQRMRMRIVRASGRALYRAS